MAQVSRAGALGPKGERFLDLLYAANQRLNLTRVARPDAPRRHLEEALCLLDLVPWEDGATAIDLGTGGGVPGIPLALALPRVHFRLLERTRKKAGFLEAVVRELQLSNVVVVAEDSRAHAASRGFRPARYLVSRAAAPLPRLLPELAGLLAPGGTALLLVGEREAVPEGIARLGLEGAELIRSGEVTVLRLRRRAGPEARWRDTGAAAARP